MAIGELHHMECVVERCPRCEGQYCSCWCDGREDAPEGESAYDDP